MSLFYFVNISIVFRLFGKPDDVLLSREIHPTIIGAEAFHGPVRDGKGWDRLAMVVRLKGTTFPCAAVGRRTKDPTRKKQPRADPAHGVAIAVLSGPENEAARL